MRNAQGKNVQQTKKRNVEIINNIKQTLSKPTIVEAQRTLKIMEKLIDRIGTFLHLDSDFVVKFNDINNPQKVRLNKALIQELSGDVLDLIAKEAKMEIEFKGYAVVEQQIKDGEFVEEEKIQEYNRVKKDLEYIFKSLLRLLEKNPKEVEVLKSLKSSTTTNNEAVNIYESLSNYKIIMQKKLATAAEEEDSHTRLIEELQMKIGSLEKTKNNCENDLLTLRQERAKHAEEKKEEIDKLKSLIREVRNNKEKEIEKISKECKQISETLYKEHKAKEDRLKSDINTEKVKLNKLREENSKKQTKYKNDKITNETQLIEMINSYDKDMERYTEQKEIAQKEFKRLTDQLNNLKRHFKEIEEEKKREEAILLADKKKKERWDNLEKRKGEAATRIKEAYRLWKAKNKKKKKKKR